MKLAAFQSEVRIKANKLDEIRTISFMAMDPQSFRVVLEHVILKDWHSDKFNGVKSMSGSPRYFTYWYDEKYLQIAVCPVSADAGKLEISGVQYVQF